MWNNKWVTYGRVIAVLAVCAGSAQARTTTTKNVIVDLTGQCNRSSPASLDLVLTADGVTQTIPVSRLSGQNDWTGSAKKSFIAEHAIASLRFSGLRTDCSPVSDVVQRGAYFAVFTFECTNKATVDLGVTNGKSARIYYQRTLDTSCSDDDEIIAEANDFWLWALRIRDEKLSLQFRSSPSQPSKTAFLVLSPDKGTVPLFVPDPENPKALALNPRLEAFLDKNARNCRTTHDRVCLTSAQLAQVLSNQGMRITGNSIEILQGEVEKAGVDRFTLAVK